MANEHQEWPSLTHHFTVADHDGYVIIVMDSDGEPIRMEMRIAKEGSTLSGLLDALASSVTLGLQRGVPIQDYSREFRHQRFTPEGYSGNPKIGYATSIVDYIGRWLELRWPRDRPAPPDAFGPAARLIDEGETCPHCGAPATQPGEACPECGHVTAPEPFPAPPPEETATSAPPA